MLQRGRHGRRLPGREPRADGVAAAARAREVLRPRRAGGDHPPGPDRRRHGATLLRRGAGREPVEYPHPVPRADPEAHARRAALPGAAPADRHGRGRTSPAARPRSCGARWASSARVERMAAIEDELRAGMSGERHRRRGAGADRQVDHVVRAVRLPRVARRELRADRVRERVPEGAPSRGVLRGAPQRLADGLLPPGDAGQGRAAPRRDGAADRRHALRLEVPVGGAARVRLGLRFVAGAAGGDRRTAIEARAGAGAVRDRRGPRAAVRLREDELDALAHAGALAAFGLTRRGALWQVAKVGAPARPALRPECATDDAVRRCRR